MKSTIILLFIFVFLSACTTDDGINTPEEIAESANIDVSQIKKIVEIETAKLVFYVPSDKTFSVGLAWIKNNAGKWEWERSSSLQNFEHEDVTYSWSNLDRMTSQGKGYLIFWGIINNDEIARVHADYRNGWELNRDAEIITVGEKRIWYVLADYYYGTIPGVDIVGYSTSGEKLYEHY